MALLSVTEVTLAFGGPPLLERVSFQVEKGEKVCLIGRNGTGKSSLLKLLHGDLVPDQGTLAHSPGMRTAYLPQEVPNTVGGSVFDVVLSGLEREAALLDRYHRLSEKIARQGQTAERLKSLETVQTALDAGRGWLAQGKVESVLAQLQLPAEEPFENLSAGLKRRVLLARALVSEPDLLLLDEPTNHLDLQAIDQLEAWLRGYSGTLLFVTHDRRLIRETASRIVELDRGRLIDWACDYRTFLDRRQALYEAEENQNRVFDKKLAAEEAWVRKGLKARRTRNEGRVRALNQLRELRRARRQRVGDVKVAAQQVQRSGKLVVEASRISHAFGAHPVIKDFSTTILRGDKVGLIGPNGAGKTTLLRILLGELAPQQGSVRLGTNLQVAYFDQLRAQLDEQETLQDNVAEGNDVVTINGRPRHIIGYLKDFLFTPEQARGPIRRLSGGERNRLALAKLFAKPANLLVLDEPTNDLDMETLEILEQWLVTYTGTVLLVSHDRAFLNHVVTSTVVFEGAGQVREYVGGYDDWLQQRAVPAAKSNQGKRNKAGKPKRGTSLQAGRDRRLNYREKQELAGIPARIEALEAEQAELYGRMAEPGFYRGDGAEIKKTKERLETLSIELEHAYQRWETLEAIAGEPVRRR